MPMTHSPPPLAVALPDDDELGSLPVLQPAASSRAPAREMLSASRLRDRFWWVMAPPFGDRAIDYQVGS
jgi:hypothetical protein